MVNERAILWVQVLTIDYLPFTIYESSLPFTIHHLPALMEHQSKSTLTKRSGAPGSPAGQPGWGGKLTSLLWWALTRYGRIKHRYLLPVYRRLGLIGKERRADGTLQPSWTLRSAEAMVRTFHHTFYRDQLKAVMDRVQTSKGAVVFLPSVSWKVVNTQR